LGFFFPDADKKHANNHHNVQRTLALIRPTALAKHKDQILKKIKDHGFKIAMTKTIRLERNQVEEFYGEHKDKAFFDDLVAEMTR
jgi:nucleoside diphosphate kinase